MIKKVGLLFLVIPIVVFNLTMTAFSEDIPSQDIEKPSVNGDSEVDEIRKKMNFKTFTPQLESKWLSNVKVESRNIDEIPDTFILTYQDHQQSELLHIRQREAPESMSYIQDQGEIVNISGNDGRLLSDGKFYWLQWIQDGTLLYMYSERLTKDDMLNTARSMQ
ncbi:hypothetical protein BEP19_04175 [Ammoniphilus oxalaticus]|uniref:DUF4367 domain-containing protein n=1 Tax=Ammoniphilus oxalaticus TaxID=66863 RepID=A0A419SLU4_9BACL|nr:DUF4367 domain-containing protein [Ammoniphilus oxalaticus]RKD25031.1 hypothetical protein BEP19_04175 [Ammoniphilus oxalaticus]